MMPSLDHCMNKQTEMTTISNSLEMFDTYKHREEKDSDEESFHLPLDDDETEPKVQDGAKNETEDDILNKFDSATATFESNVDVNLEDRLLNDADEKNGTPAINGIAEENSSAPVDSPSAIESPHKRAKKIATSDLTEEVPLNDCSQETNIKAGDGGSQGQITESTDVPNVAVDINLTNKSESSAVGTLNQIKDTLSDCTTNEINKVDDIKNTDDEGAVSVNGDDKNKQEKFAEKSENSNDSLKQQNEDSEDLFDISIIRDAEEDNAESAYNETEENHVEESEEYDDANDEKLEDPNNKPSNVEDEEEEENEEQEDHLKNDDVDIEESTLKLDCDKEVSDKDSDESNKIKDIGTSTEKSLNSAAESTVDAVTANISSDSTLSGSSDKLKSASAETPLTANNDSEKRKSLKRGISEEEVEENAVKRSRTEEPIDVEAKEAEKKPKQKLPLKTLLSLSEFIKAKKTTRRLTMHDLEEFCLQKICEVVVHKSDLGDVHHQLKLQEQLIESMRKEIQQLTKQARDLEIVNKKLMNDLKLQIFTQKPLNPLKITRSVGLQVKFTPAFDSNVKRRQSSNATTSKSTSQTANRGARNVANATTPTGVNRQVSSPKQQPVLKPNTPLLSQALSRRAVVNDNTNKTPTPPNRPKPSDPKTVTPSASVIDLTDEDDKNKNTIAKPAPPKNITVPLRTTPVRVNTTTGIRLTTPQGKVAPITSVVTSNAGQVMYLVQSSPQNVVSTLGQKAVVVNFQSTNGVLTSALNGSAVSVIPKPGNTIQLKTMSPVKPLTTPNKVVKLPNKHPAPLPPPPIVRVSLDKPLKPIPPKPHLTIRKTDTGIILQWKMPYELEMYEVIASYQLYAYQETSAMPSTDMWRKVGDVKALALPMACTLTQFADKNKYYFAVRPVDIHKRIGVFSEPEEISL